MTSAKQEEAERPQRVDSGTSSSHHATDRLTPHSCYSKDIKFNGMTCRSRPIIVTSFHFQWYSLQLTGTVSESGTCTCELRINRPKHSMFTAFASSSQVRLSSTTNTQGSPSNRLTYICFAELRHACSRNVSMEMRHRFDLISVEMQPPFGLNSRLQVD